MIKPMITGAAASLRCPDQSQVTSNGILAAAGVILTSRRGNLNKPLGQP